MAMSQTIEDVIEEILTEINGDDEVYDRVHKLEVDTVKWEGDVAKITVDCPDIGLYPTSLFLSAEQSAKLRDPKDKNQVYSVGLYLGKIKKNVTGDKLFDYWWSCRVFEGVENDKVYWVEPTSSPPLSTEMSVQRESPQFNSKPMQEYTSQPETTLSQPESIEKKRVSVQAQKQDEIAIAMCFRIACERLISLEEKGSEMNADFSTQAGILGHQLWQEFKELRSKNAIN